MPYGSKLKHMKRPVRFSARAFFLPCAKGRDFALPIAAAAVVGMENIPTALNVLIITFALIAAVGETVNLICGFVEVNRRSFKMKTGALSAVCSLQVIQLLLFGATAWKLFKII